MSWPTVIWSMVAAAAITMALPHLVIGLRSREARVNLLFAVAALAVAGTALMELGLMHATTTGQAGGRLRAGQTLVVVAVAAIVGFVHFYFGTARPWLGFAAAGLRGVCLIPNFVGQPVLNFTEITGLRHFSFLGEMVAMPEGKPSPWLGLAYLSSLFFLVYVFDASLRLWRGGGADGRRRALFVGGGIVFFIVLAQGASVFINAGRINFPFFVSIPFMLIVAAMGFELSCDVIRAAQLARALQASEERMSLAAESARLSLWEWDSARGEIWMTDRGPSWSGSVPPHPLDCAALTGKVHPDDRAAREAAIRRAVETGGTYEMEYRTLQSDGTLGWIAARGRCVRDGGSAPRLLGISMDITQQKHADTELRQQREELGHLSRVVLLGEMASSLAHELNQPLTAIVTNASAAQRFLARGVLKTEDLRELLADIAADGHRASEVIRSIKGMARKAVNEARAVDLDDVVTDVLRLVRADARAQGCALETDLEPGLPAVTGDTVQLQQVLLNLIVNAFDAMRQNSDAPRRVVISTRLISRDTVEVAVRDTGPGLPAGMAVRLFERFYSTKAEGMGMGLAIARSIIEAHLGKLEGENVAPEASPSPGSPPTPARGARFWFQLPVRTESKEATA